MARLPTCHADGCSNKFERFHSFQTWCSPECGVKIARKKQKIAEQNKLARLKKEKQKERAEIRKAKERLKTIPQLAKEAQAAVNKYVRLRDYLEPCISCGKSKEEVEAEQGWKTGGAWDAGHFMSRGAKSQLRFNLFNIHKQCKSCNAGSGKWSRKEATVSQEYEERLVNKIGQDKVDELKNNNEVVRYTPDYLRRIKKVFTKRARLAHKRLVKRGVIK